MLRDVEAPTFVDNRLTDVGEVVSLMVRPPFIPRKIPGIHFCFKLSGARAIVRLEGLGQLKNPTTSSGTEPPMLPRVPNK
jgi:hypothetical protein